MKFTLDNRLIVTLLGLFFLSLALFISPPLNFPVGSTVTIKEGSTLFEISRKLQDERIINFPVWFRMFAIILGGENSMQAGEYKFSLPQNSLQVAIRMVQGDHNLDLVKITIPEGYNVFDIAKLFKKEFPFFDEAKFLSEAPEGYLFPDTYFFPMSTTASTTIKKMNDNFYKKIKALEEQIMASNKSLEEIISMASIIEREANRSPDREIISGILWSRLEKGIPLQVDASFIYVNGETTFDLSLSDLKIDSPYNTYVYKGLPPTPIANPGIKSIEASLNPTKSPYLYFLTGHDGHMYYAKTFNEHIENKKKYLR